MIIEHPGKKDIPKLRALWQEAFSDTDAFLDLFFTQIFAPERALAVKEGETLLAALYWFDCLCGKDPYAYIYAVATKKEYRGKGHCRALMTKLHEEMENCGKCTVLVPADKELRKFYARLGYKDFGGMDEISIEAAGCPVAAERLSVDAYMEKRRQLLPDGGILQEGETKLLLADMLRFYGGEGWLLAGGCFENEWVFPEFLGDKNLLPGILKVLEIPCGRISVAGTTPFGMFRAGERDISAPSYFAFALD